MSLGLFQRGSFPGDKGILIRGHRAVFVVAVNFSFDVHEERSMPQLSVRLRSCRQLEIIVVAICVWRDAITEEVAALFSGSEVRRYQRSLIGRNLVRRRGAQLRERFRQLAKRVPVSLYGFSELMERRHDRILVRGKIL